MNYIWWQVDVQACTERQRGDTSKNFMFLVRYDNPAIRGQVVQQLKAMQASGLNSLRTFVFFGAEPVPDYFNVYNDGERAGRLLNQYVHDVAEAGFRHLEIEYSVMGSAGPHCRPQCSDLTKIPDSVAFVLTARSALTVPSSLDLSFDLSNESCSPDTFPEPFHSNLLAYLHELVPAYLRKFPNDSTTVSCGARSFLGGRRSIDEAYQAAGRRHPDFYEVHLYRTTSPRFSSISAAVNDVVEALSGTTVPVVIGETGYGDGETVRALVDGLHGAGGGLKAIYFWPRHDPSVQCPDVAPPYLLRDALADFR